jgi:hypothetical protein
VGGLRRAFPCPGSRTWGTRFCGFPRLSGFAPPFRCFWGVVAEVFEEGLDDALVFGFAEFGAGGERAVDGVGDDLFDQIGFGFAAGLAGGRGFAGEVEAGDLEAVEEQAGTFGVDLVAGDALEDLADGGLDGAAVFGEGQVEVGVAGVWVFHGAAGGVVVVAELFVAKAGAAAAAAVGEDVAALVAFRFFLHGGIPPRYFWS